MDQGKRESWVFYRSFYEAGQCLNEEQRGKYYTLIFEYMFDFTRWTSDDPIVNAMFMLIAPQVEANIRKFFNWMIPKDKQSVSKTEADYKQDESKTQGNVDVYDNVDANEDENMDEEKNYNTEILELVEKFTSIKEKAYNETKAVIRKMGREAYIDSQYEAVEKLMRAWHTLEQIEDVAVFCTKDPFRKEQVKSLSKLDKPNKEWVKYINVLLDKIK
jgi:hypothetical protein